MSHDISIEYKGEYLHVRHTGADSYEISLDLWRRVMKACAKHRCTDILGESDNTNTLSTLDAFRHIEIFHDVGITVQHRIAWVNHNQSGDRIFEFIEDVLKNRFVVNGHMFKTVALAKQWLLDKTDHPAG